MLGDLIFIFRFSKVQRGTEMGKQERGKRAAFRLSRCTSQRTQAVLLAADAGPCYEQQELGNFTVHEIVQGRV